MVMWLWLWVAEWEMRGVGVGGVFAFMWMWIIGGEGGDVVGVVVRLGRELRVIIGWCMGRETLVVCLLRIHHRVFGLCRVRWEK